VLASRLPLFSRAALAAALAAARQRKHLLLEASELSFVSSAGLRVIISAVKALKPATYRDCEMARSEVQIADFMAAVLYRRHVF
jgi:hypothetical protein